MNATQLALIQFAIRFGLDAAIALANGFKMGDIDSTIAALELAKTKTAADYLAEDKAASTVTA